MEQASRNVVRVTAKTIRLCRTIRRLCSLHFFASGRAGVHAVDALSTYASWQLVRVDGVVMLFRAENSEVSGEGIESSCEVEDSGTRTLKGTPKQKVMAILDRCLTTSRGGRYYSRLGDMKRLQGQRVPNPYYKCNGVRIGLNWVKAIRQQEHIMAGNRLPRPTTYHSERPAPYLDD